MREKKLFATEILYMCQKETCRNERTEWRGPLSLTNHKHSVASSL